MVRNYFSAVIVAFFIISLFGCENDYSPKPYGYYRIDTPAADGYTVFDTGTCPFTFQYPSYAKVVPDNDPDAEPCWFNIEVPELNATLHLSYKEIDSRETLYELVRDAFTFVGKHTSVAEGIQETRIEKGDVQGVIFDLKGNTASAVQFFVTDSTNHYLRGSLYVNAPANRDSLKPVVSFMRNDVMEMLESFEWKEAEE